jgi:hypothetical protein
MRCLWGLSAVLAICIVATVATACGSSGKLPAYASPSATAKTLKIRKIEDGKYRFRMAYPFGWVGTRYENPKPGGPEGTLQAVAAFADPKGAQASGSYVDSVQVAVYQLDRPLSPGDLTLESASSLMYRVILRDIASVSPRTNVEPIKVHGVPAWRAGYQYKVGGEIVDANSTLIVKGKWAYWMTTQSGAYTWRTVSPILATCEQYFEVL